MMEPQDNRSSDQESNSGVLEYKAGLQLPTRNVMSEK